jgi:hypothetical protein
MKRYMPLVLLLAVSAGLTLSACKGKQGPQGPAGSTGNNGSGPAVQTPYCTNPTSQGATLTTNDTSKAPERLRANSVTLTTAANGVSLSIYIGSGPVTGQIRLGLYGDTGSNYPNQLIAEVAPFTPKLSQWNSVAIPNVYLNAGTYWIAELFSDGAGSNTSTYINGGIWIYSNTDYGWSQLPAVFPASYLSGAFASSVYLSTCP